MDTTERAAASPLVRAAAQGRLPAWAEASAKRREHMARVAALLDAWAEGMRLPGAERERWRAAGWLHDALRDAEPEALRAEVGPEFSHLPGPALHGPAAAVRLAGDADAELRLAVRFHTIGHPDFGVLGRALYLADFLEPGRDFAPEWRAALRERVPTDMRGVLREVVAARIRHLLEKGKPIHPETAAFWSALVREGA